MNASKPAPAVPLLALIAAYGCAVVWLTWPLAADLRNVLPCTDVACGFDTLYSAWVLAWQSHALATDPAGIADANIYYPAPDALFYGPAGFGALPYYAPSFLLTGSAALATNVMLMVCATLSAVSLHWVVRRWTGLDAAGVVAAAALLLHPWYLWGFVASTTHLSPLQYFPLIVWLAAAREPTRGRTALLVALIVAQCLTDPVYVAAAVVAPLGLLAAWRLVRRDTRRSGFALVAALVVSLLCLVPFVLGYLQVRAANPGIAEQTVWTGNRWTSDLGTLFWRNPSPTTIAPPVMVLLVVGAALAVLRRRKRGGLTHDPGWQHGALWLLVGTWISLSPVARLGSEEITLPQALLAATTPLYEIIRVSIRLGVAALIGACILAGIAFAEIVHALDRALQRGRPIALQALLAGCAVVALYIVRPFGTEPIPAAYRVQSLPRPPAAIVSLLRQGTGSIVQLPAMRSGNPRPHARYNAMAMYLSTFHWRPLVNGYSSYWPDGFLARMELTTQLPARDPLRRLVKASGLRAIWVNLGGYPRPRERARWRDAEIGLVPGLQLRAREGDHLLFTLDPRVFGRGAERRRR